MLKPSISTSRILGLGRALCWIALMGIAVLRSAVFFTDQLYFDVDPAMDPSALPGLGPKGSLILDVIVIVLAALALIGEALARRRLDWFTVLLAVLPAPIMLYHGWDELGNVWRGSTWLAAVFAAAAVAHLARSAAMRRMFLALLVAVAAPLLVRGAMQVTVEHQQTIQQFEQHKEQFFAQRGWQPGSPEAQIYERRLRQPAPTGWFVTSNIYASAMGFAVVIMLGTIVGALRAIRHHAEHLRDAIGWLVLAGLFLLGSAGALWLTGSKGAAGATLLGAAVFGVWHVKAARRVGGVTLLGLVALVLGGIVIRGWLLPEGFLGEKSLLFRWQYWIGAIRMLNEHGLLGVGPDGFQQIYTMFRVPRSPEEIAAPHNVFLAWLTAFGALGLAWCILNLRLLWRAGQSAFQALDERIDPAAQHDERIMLFKAPLIGLVALMTAVVFEAHTLSTVAIGTRSLGVIGYVLMALAVHHLLTHIDDRTLACISASGALVLIIHGQIDMTFSQPGSALWAMTALGVAGGAAAHGWTSAPIRHNRWIAGGIAVVCMTLVFVLWRQGIVPASAHQQARERAVYILQIQEQPIIQRRTAAAEQLIKVYDTHPVDHRTANAAIEQLMRAAGNQEGRTKQSTLGRAAQVAERVITRHGRGSTIGLAARVHEMLAEVASTSENARAQLNQAINYAERLTEIDPQGINPWRRLGDLYWNADEYAKAAQAYRRALRNSANFELDPLKQLPQSQRLQIDERLAEAQAHAAEQKESPP